MIFHVFTASLSKFICCQKALSSTQDPDLYLSLSSFFPAAVLIADANLLFIIYSFIHMQRYSPISNLRQRMLIKAFLCSSPLAEIKESKKDLIQRLLDHAADAAWEDHGVKDVRSH